MHNIVFTTACLCAQSLSSLLFHTISFLFFDINILISSFHLYLPVQIVFPSYTNFPITILYAISRPSCVLYIPSIMSTSTSTSKRSYAYFSYVDTTHSNQEPVAALQSVCHKHNMATRTIARQMNVSVCRHATCRLGWT